MGDRKLTNEAGALPSALPMYVRWDCQGSILRGSISMRDLLKVLELRRCHKPAHLWKRSNCRDSALRHLAMVRTDIGGRDCECHQREGRLRVLRGQLPAQRGGRRHAALPEVCKQRLSSVT